MYKCRKGELKNIPEDVLALIAGQLSESGDRETLASFGLVSSAFHEIASRHQCSRLRLRFGALDAPLTAMRLHSIINIRRRESSIREVIVDASKAEVEGQIVDIGTGLLNAWTTAFLAILPRLTGLTSFTWNYPENLPLPVMKAITSHDRISTLSLALKEDNSSHLLPALNDLVEQRRPKLQFQNLSVCTGLPQEQSANSMEALASPTEKMPPPFRNVLRKLIVHSLAMKTLMFRNEHDVNEEETMLAHREYSLMAPMTKKHPLRSLSIRGTTGMATYTLFGVRLSNLTRLKLQNTDDCTKLIGIITCGTPEINLKFLRVAGLVDPARGGSRSALINLLKAFQGLEQIELDGLEIDDFIDVIVNHGATLHTVSLVDTRDENDRAILERRAASYSKLAKGCPHLRQLRVNEIPNLVGIADAFVGNALQRFDRLETLILMPSPRSSPSMLRPISEIQIYSAARDVMSQKLKTLEVIGAYIPTHRCRFDVVQRTSRADIVHPKRAYHWRIDCRKHNLSPINMVGQIDQERDLLILRRHERLAKCMGQPELNGDALRTEAISRYHEAIQRLSQASDSSPEGLIVTQTLQQSCNDLESSIIISLGYDCRHAQNDLRGRASIVASTGN